MATLSELDRRRFLRGCLALGTGALAAAPFKFHRNPEINRRRPVSHVAILNAESYSGKLEQLLMDGLSLFKPAVKGKKILLKPNLVEFVPGKEVTTHPALVGAAAECFLRLGAQRVIVAEGSGHQRDTDELLVATGLREQLRQRRVEFVDLNRDDLTKIRLKSNYTGLGHLCLPNAVLNSDFVVSMPKVKTHHWAGVTLSLKNMFGIVPGMKYGWPKNLLHWRGINESIVDICATVPVDFVIADGIVAMEGNGPLHGSSRQLGALILADDPVAADATASRIMTLSPERLPYLREAARFLGNVCKSDIQQLAAPIESVRQPFQVLPAFSSLVDSV